MTRALTRRTPQIHRREWMLTASATALLPLTGPTVAGGGSLTAESRLRPSCDAVDEERYDWPDFLGPFRNGQTTQPIRQRDWAALPLRWRIPLGEGYTIGSCLGDRFVQTDRIGDQERTFCLDARTGQIVWQQQRPTAYRDLYGYDGGPRCSPILTADAIITYGVDGVLVARDWNDGHVLWQRDLNRDYHVVQNFFGVGSAPIVFRDRLWVMVGGSPIEDLEVAPGALDQVHPNGTAMVAVSLKTGETLNEVGQDLASYSSPVIVTLRSEPQQGESKPAGQDVVIGLAFCRSGLLAFDPENGRQHFHFPFRSTLLESVNAATPVVVGNQVLLSETYSVGSVLLELDPADLSRPRIVWQDEPNVRDQSLQAHWSTPVVHEGLIYASSGRHTGNAELRCVEWATGKVRWRQPGLSRCSLTKAAGGDLVVLAERGELFLLRATAMGYERVTTHRFSEPGQMFRYPAWASPALANGSLFCRDKQNVFCFEI